MSAIGTHRLSRRVQRDFRCWSLTGTATAVPIFLSLTQCMVRPCVARGLVDLSVCGLASKYPASDWSVCAPGHHGHQRAYVLICGQASRLPRAGLHIGERGAGRQLLAIATPIEHLSRGASGAAAFPEIGAASLVDWGSEAPPETDAGAGKAISEPKARRRKAKGCCYRKPIVRTGRLLFMCDACHAQIVAGLCFDLGEIRCCSHFRYRKT
jgi:hypothetical protein